jgi:hypothetical protein
MRPLLGAIALCVAASFAAPAFASPTSDALGACLVDKSTGGDRRALARWIFVAMSAHPQLQDLFDMTPQTRETVNKAAADVFVRLVTADCNDETRAAIDVEGAIAMKTAFGKLGEVAMGELTTNKAVQAEFEGLTRYMDRDKMKAAFAPR